MKGESSERIYSIVKTLCNAEGKDVVLQFDEEEITAPDSKYNGFSHEKKTIPKATLNATVSRAELADEGRSLVCSAELTTKEMERVGINESVVQTGEENCCVVNISANRQWWLKEYDDLTQEKAETAIEQNREEEVLPPWDTIPTVTTKVKRTSECINRYYDSGFYIQYASPEYEMGSLLDVRIN
jgi:hypothetical protein